MKSQKKYLKLSPEEKLSLLIRYTDGESITKITSEYGISRTIFYKWLKKYKSSRKIRLEKRLDPLPQKSKKHWRKLSVRKEREVINLWLNNPDYSVRKIASLTGQSIGGVFNIVERYKKEKAQKAPRAIKRYKRKNYKAITPLQKLDLLNRHDSGEPVTKITKEAGISRTIFYKWMREFERGMDKEVVLASRRPRGEAHWRFISGVREMVLEVIAQNPAASLSGIAQAVNAQGKTVSRSGLYYMLKNMQLASYEDRLEYLTRHEIASSQDEGIAKRYAISAATASFLPQFAIFTIFWLVSILLVLTSFPGSARYDTPGNIGISPSAPSPAINQFPGSEPETHIVRPTRSNQDFRWGAAAVNSPRSAYAPGEDIKLGFGVVDHAGNTVCDGLIGWEIVDPEGDKVFDGGVSGEDAKPSGQCSLQSVTSMPDYLASIGPVKNTGVYKLNFDVSTYEGKRKFSTELVVAPDQPFEITRSSYPTRVFPPAVYPVEFKIKAKQDFRGTIAESLPPGITASSVSGGGIIYKNQARNERKVKWDVDMKKDKTYTFSLNLHFPQVWPEFYELGPVIFTDKKTGKKVFSEERYWQVVADAL